MKNNMITRNDPFGLIDPFFDEFFTSESNSHLNQIMRTDIIDEGDHYEFNIEVPAIKKEDIKLLLEDGYLTVEATQEDVKEEDEEEKYVRRERYYGSYKRSFYVGEDVTNEDIKATLEDGVLTLDINKKEPEKEEKNYIEIE